MTRKDVKNIKQMHSKRTGAIILFVLAFLVIGGSAFMYLANEENKKFEIELDNFQALSCDEIDNMDNLERWQREAYLNKIRAGDCTLDPEKDLGAFIIPMIPIDCPALFENLERETDPETRQLIHDELKKNEC